MTKDYITLIAAGIALISSIVTLYLNTRLALSKEKRVLLWKREVERLFEIEELAGMAQECALDYKLSEKKREGYMELRGRLESAAGRVGRYPDLAKALRQLNHWCAIGCSFSEGTEQMTNARDEIPQLFEEVLKQCDLLTKR